MNVLYDPRYWLMAAPAFLLMLWAQFRVKSAYAQGMKVPAGLSGAAAARFILDQAGLHDVDVEETQGMLSDHYDPRHRVLRLSHEVYHNRTATSVGIAAHEAGHALQHAHGYMPLALRSAAVPAAIFGPTASILLLIAGAMLQAPALIFFGLVAFGGVVLFQVITLPVEFDASNRAKALLSQLNIVDGEGEVAVRNVLNAAGWTYVAAALSAVMTLLYYIMRFGGAMNRDD
jgi:uncharacterized protein